MGFEAKAAAHNSVFGNTFHEFAYSNVLCTGFESYLFRCKQSELLNSLMKCAPNEAAGVFCDVSGTPPPRKTLLTPYSEVFFKSQP